MQVTTIRNDRGGWRWEWEKLPAAGAGLLLNDGRQVRYLGLGPCGMLEVEDEIDGGQFLLMPHMVAGVAAPANDFDTGRPALRDIADDGGTCGPTYRLSGRTRPA